MTDGIDLWRILKWVLIVLLAGFIGQFGKTLAIHIMARVKAGERGVPSGAEQPEKRVELTGEKDLSKIPEDIFPEQAEERAKQEKKALKALVKQKKKEAKSTEKQEQ